ncbi:MAG: BlaI/MecI/CopY family transcriptional regulator [Chloroflexi bacterium]|nr:BlaI/MecI/CopY family transcriptional regulator [Chloroflexota bacterium]
MDDNAGVQTFRLNNKGLARVFGELEASIMEAVWDRGAATVQDVCDALGDGTNYKTITTVMNRLVKKGILKRTLMARCFVYKPSQSRDEFANGVAHSVVSGLLQDFGEPALAQFIDAIDDVEPSQLERLQRLIEQKTSKVRGG